MTIKTVGFALIMLSMTAVSADAEETEGAEADQAQSAEPAKSTETAKNKDKDSYDPDKRRCKRIAMTGSRIRSRVCATNREWKESEKRAQESTEKMQRRPQQGQDSG